MGSFEAMRRPELADLMLLATVTLWALNFTVTKYVISHGFAPIAYGVLRFGVARRSSSQRSPGARERSFAAQAPRPRHAGRRRADRDLPEPALVRLRDQAHDGDDGRAPVRDAARDDRRSSPAPARDRAARLPLLDRGRRSRSAGAALVALGSGDGRLGPALGRPARLRGLGHVGLVHGRGLAAPAALLDAARQRASPSRSGRSRCSSSARRSSPSQDYAPAGATVWLLLAFAIVGPLVVANLLWFGGDQPRRALARLGLRQRCSRSWPRSSRC